MVVLDVSIVNVALPSIGRDLHYSATGLQWVVNAYVLTFAGFLLLGGRAADLFGRRRVFLVGLGLFTVASLAGGLAQNSAWLTAARAVQGIGGALLSPATLTIIVTTFSPIAGPGPRDLERGGRRRRRRRIDPGRHPHLGAVLALGAVRQHPHRGDRHDRGPAWLTSRSPEASRPTGVSRAPRPALDVAGAITVTAGLAALIYAIVGTEYTPGARPRPSPLLGGGWCCWPPSRSSSCDWPAAAGAVPPVPLPLGDRRERGDA